MAFPLIPLIAAATTLGGNAINNRAQANLNMATRTFNWEMFEAERRNALTDWNMQNEYNSPAAQMKRLKDAGLNPNLVYGDGATATSAQQVKANAGGQWSPQAPKWDVPAIANPLMQIYDIQNTQQQTDNLKAAKEVSVQDAILRAQQTMESAIRTSRSEFDLNQAKSLQPMVLEAAKQSLEKLKADTTFTLSENERKAAQNTQSLQKGVEEILLLKLAKSKTKEETEMIRQAIKNARVDEDIKKEDLRLKKQQVDSKAPWWINLIEKYVGDFLNSTPVGTIFNKGASGWTSPGKFDSTKHRRISTGVVR